MHWLNILEKEKMNDLFISIMRLIFLPPQLHKEISQKKTNCWQSPPPLKFLKSFFFFPFLIVIVHVGHHDHPTPLHTHPTFIFFSYFIYIFWYFDTWGGRVWTLRCGVYVLGGMRFSFFFFFLCTRCSWGTKVTIHTVLLLFTHYFVFFTHFSHTLFSHLFIKNEFQALFTHLKIILLQCF